jgi:NIMA (never in mitosis gene a)-related kinase 1/4/5
MEIDLMARLDNHFIVGYFDSFIDDQTINIVMEYCSKHDLCSYIKKQKTHFIENFVWKVFIHICLGVQYLHSKSIIHRDLKSLNIFLTKDNSAKVGDLGASRQIDDQGNIIDDESNHKVGTPFYLAPELWNDRPYTKKTDIWALGVILYEMCAL